MLPGKFTPPPARPKIPRPRVHGESSESRNETPVARFDPTPLFDRLVPERSVGGNWPPIESAGRIVWRWALGRIKADPSRNSWRSRALIAAGFQ